MHSYIGPMLELNHLMLAVFCTYIKSDTIVPCGLVNNCSFDWD